MAYSFYDGTVVAARNALDSLSHLLNVAEKQPNASTLLSARLYDDMRPLTSQVHLAAQTIDRLLARLDCRDHVPIEDNLATFEDMRERIQTAQKALDEADMETINRRGDESAHTALTPQLTIDMTGADFAAGASIPNLYFHLSIAYAILRKEGVPLGKWDYIQGFMNPQLAKAQ